MIRANNLIIDAVRKEKLALIEVKKRISEWIGFLNIIIAGAAERIEIAQAAENKKRNA